MVRRETADRQEASGGIFRERDGLFRAPEQSGGSERYQVSGVNDPAEVRAERTPDAVMGGGVFREADSHASGDGIFRQAEGPGPEGGPAELSSADLSEPGGTLPGDLRQSMGESMGADFSDVRVHTGPGADRASRQISARAFTRGRDVYFRSGTYDPGSREGQHLIAHELAHVAGGDDGLHRNWFTDQMDRWRNRRNAGQQQGQQQQTQGQQQGQPQGQQQQQGQQQGQQQQQPTARVKGPNASFDITTDKAADLDKRLASKVNDWAAGVETDFTTFVRGKKLDELKEKYVSKTKPIVTTELHDDEATVVSLSQKLLEIENKIGKLDEGLGEENVEPEIRAAYQNAKTKLETAANNVRQDIKNVGENVNSDINANENAPMSDLVRTMLLDPVFTKFRELAAKLQAAKGSSTDKADFDKGENAAEKTMGSQSAKTSLEDKQGALGLERESEQGSKLSKISQGFSAAGEATGGLGGSIGGVTGAATDHVEGGKIKKKNLSGEDKEKAEEEAGKLSEKRSGAAQSITEGTGELISVGAGVTDTVKNSQEAAAQRKQDLNAKNAMKNIAMQLRRTVPAGKLTANGEERNKRILAVCTRIERKRFSGKGENDSMVALIDSALEEGISPALTDSQKKLLNNLKMMEMSRSSSKDAAKKMRKESIFSSLDAFGSLLRGAGGITSGIGSLLDSSVTSLIGSVLSAVGSIFGMIGAIRGALSPEDEGDEENKRKMEASKAAIKQMAELPTVADWNPFDKVAKGDQNAPKIERAKMDDAEKYAAVFYSIQASNVNMADILYAVEKGEFGKDLGNNQTKTAETSMKDMYENLSMS